MSVRRIAVVSLLIVAFGGAVGAQAQGDAERGRVLAETCSGCHGIRGYRNAYPSYRVPMLGGQHAAYIVASLKAYRNKERPHLTMQAQAATLSDQDMEDLGAYFASQGEAKDAPVRGQAPDAAATCVSCHSDDGTGMTPEWPTLAGQHEDYLIESLRQYKAGTRTNAVMGGLVIPLTDEDIVALSKFYARQAGLFTTVLD